MILRIAQITPSTLPKNIIILAKGMNQTKKTGGEQFQKVPIESAHHQGIKPSSVAGVSWVDFVEVFAGGPVEGRNEVQTITPDAAPTAGNFKLTFSGIQTGNIAYNASAATIQSALEGLSSVGAGNVSVSGTLATALVITFINALGKKDQSALSIDVSGLTTTTSATVVETVKGKVETELKPELDMTGVFQVKMYPGTTNPIQETTDAGNVLYQLEAVEFVRNQGV